MFFYYAFRELILPCRACFNQAKPIERAAFWGPERIERQERPYTERPYLPTPEAPPPTPALQKPNLPGPIFDIAKDLRGTLEAVVFDEAGKELSKMPVSELAEKIPSIENAHLVLFDGAVTQRLLDIAAGKNIRYVIGDRVSDGAKRPSNINVITLTDLSSFGPN